MTVALGRLRDAVLPLAVFAAAAGAHVVWLGLFPEKPAAQSAWASLPPEGPTSWVPRYLEAQDYLLGYSYGLSLAFATVALRRLRRNRSCGAGKFAVGGLTFSGLLAVGACYLIGCCGSPLLAVWLNLFGAAFLPFAKPLVAVFSTLSVAAAWWRMARATAPSCDHSARSCG